MVSPRPTAMSGRSSKLRSWLNLVLARPPDIWTIQMIALSQHPGRLMMLLHVYYLGKAYVLRQMTSRWLAKERRMAFYEKAWQEAAADVGATVEPLGYEILEIRS